MSLLITGTGVPIQPLIQTALTKDQSRLIITGSIATAALASVANIALSPLHALYLTGKDLIHLEGASAAYHAASVLLDPARNALLALVLLVTAAASLIFGQKTVAFFFDGTHALKEEKYQTVLSQHKTLLGNLDVHINSLKGEYRKSPLAEPLLKCLQALQQTDDPRESYKQFVSHLDKVSTMILSMEGEERSHETSQCIALAKQIVKDRWTRIEMKEHFQDRLEHAVPTPSSPTAENLPDHIKTMNEQIRHSSPDARKSRFSLSLQQLRGALGIENFTGRKNIPNRLATLSYENGQSVTYLRHGSPTQGKLHPRASETEAIVPNYELFLTTCADADEHVLYAIHQRLTPNPIDDESPRTRAILALQDRHPNFHALVQPVEGRLFRREGPYSGKTTFSELKEAIETEFFTAADSTARLPTGLPADYRTTFKTLLDNVHEIFFKNKETLEKDDWQNFILFFYVLQRIHLKTHFNVSYVVTACKDDLDRGGAQALLELFIHLSQQYKEIPEDQLAELTTHILGAPLMVKQIPMVKSRLSAALRAIQHIIEKKPALQGQKALCGASVSFDNPKT